MKLSKNALVGAALAGLLVGQAALAHNHEEKKEEGQGATAEKHGCGGKNGCGAHAKDDAAKAKKADKKKEEKKK
jgi:hypothetical protein